MQYISTGNFVARPNRATEVGWFIDYHWHDFDHTIFVESGAWRVTVHDYRDGDVELPVDRPVLGERIVAPPLFQAALEGPACPVVPMLLIRKHRWHRIELVSKTIMSPSGAQRFEAPECIFYCCFSHRDPQSLAVTVHATGWVGD